MKFLVYLLIFISFTDLFAQLPIASTYAESVGASMGFIGLIVGVYSFSNLFSNVFAGQLVDNRGPKRALIIGFLLNAIILFLYATVTTPLQLFGVRFLNGITAGIITPAAFTYLSFLSTKSKGKSMALSGASVGLAAISAPAFSGIVSSLYSPETVYVSIGIVMLVGLALTFTLKSPELAKETGKEKERSTISSYFPLFKKKGLLFAFIGAVALAVSQGILAYMLPLKVGAMGVEAHVTGMLISIFGIVAVLVFVLPTNRVFDRYRNENTLSVGLLTIAVSQTISSFTSSQAVLMLSMAIYGLGFALIFPSMAGLIANHSSEGERGKAFGLFYGFISLGSFLGSSVTGLFTLTPNQGLLSAAGFLLIVFTALRWLVKMDKGTGPSSGK